MAENKKLRLGLIGNPNVGKTTIFNAITGARQKTGNWPGIAVTSDGPEHLMFQLPEMVPGPIFSKMFEDLESGNLQRQDLLDYLTGARWSRDPRGNDDRSLSILSISDNK